MLYVEFPPTQKFLTEESFSRGYVVHLAHPRYICVFAIKSLAIVTDVHIRVFVSYLTCTFVWVLLVTFLSLSRLLSHNSQINQLLEICSMHY